jgi:hypothetical protein
MAKQQEVVDDLLDSLVWMRRKAKKESSQEDSRQEEAQEAPGEGLIKRQEIAATFRATGPGQKFISPI